MKSNRHGMSGTQALPSWGPERGYVDTPVQRQRDTKAAADAVSGLVCVANPAGEVAFTSEHWVEYIGRPISDTLGGAWLKVSHPKDVPRVLRISQEARSRGVCYEAEFRYRRHDGAYRWHVIRANPFVSLDTGEAIT